MIGKSTAWNFHHSYHQPLSGFHKRKIENHELRANYYKVTFFFLTWDNMKWMKHKYNCILSISRYTAPGVISTKLQLENMWNVAHVFFSFFILCYARPYNKRSSLFNLKIIPQVNFPNIPQTQNVPNSDFTNSKDQWKFKSCFLNSHNSPKMKNLNSGISSTKCVNNHHTTMFGTWANLTLEIISG